MESAMDILSIQLSNIIARKLKHDSILLLAESAKEDCSYAMFVDYNIVNFNTITDTKLLELDGKYVKVKYLDNDGHLRSGDSMYDELVSRLYRALKNCAAVSNGKQKLVAADVPEFMINCV